MDLIRTKKVFFQEQSAPVGNCPVGSQESRSQSENGTSLNELRKFEGNLNNIQTHLGYREPNERERQFKDIRIRWKGQTLKPTPRQLLQSKGILNELLYMSKSNKETEFFPPNKSSKRKVEKNPQTRGGSQ